LINYLYLLISFLAIISPKYIESNINSESEEKISKSLIEEYKDNKEIDQNEEEERQNGNYKSWINKCCLYLWCCF